MKLIESIADAGRHRRVRRDIHAHPGTVLRGGSAPPTGDRQLTDWGIPIHRGLGKTGVVAIRRTARAIAPSACAPTSTRCR